jgi:hypothetical protein
MSVYTIIFFTCPETAHIRSSRLNTDVRETLYGERDGDNATGSLSDTAIVSKEIQQLLVEPEPVSADLEEQTHTQTDRKVSYWASLKVYNGRFTDDSLLVSILAPFSVYMLPAVAWGAYAYGCPIAFSASFSLSLSAIFGAAPYHFTTA